MTFGLVEQQQLEARMRLSRTLYISKLSVWPLPTLPDLVFYNIPFFLGFFLVFFVFLLLFPPPRDESGDGPSISCGALRLPPAFKLLTFHFSFFQKHLSLNHA